MSAPALRRTTRSATAAIAAEAVWVALRPPGHAFQILASSVTILASIFCMLGVVHALLRTTGSERRAWALLLVALVVGVGGALAWSNRDPNLAAPMPWLATLAFAVALPIGMIALLSFGSSSRNRATQLLIFVDSVTIGGSFVFVAWASILGPVYRARVGMGVSPLIVAQPGFDIVLMSIALLLALRASGAMRMQLGLIAAGAAAMAFGDTVFARSTLTGGYHPGTLPDLGWVAGMLLVGLAAFRVHPADRTQEGSRTRTAGVFAPYGAVIAAAVTAMVVQLRDGHLEPFLFWTAVGVVLLLTARQIVVLLENMTLTHHLEQRVEARTAELAAALRDVEKARALQDAFVASISHELKTPLTNILGATATMLRPEIGLTEAQRSMTEVAQRGASRLVRMVDDLLLVSAIADAPSAETVEPFDVADTIVAAVEESTSSGPRVYVNAPQRLRALGDRESLILILAKLLDNARRFTEPGSSIWIDAFRRGELVEVVVRDEGPGIPAAFQERVFDRFFQIDSATTRAYDGAGLGLFIARTLAERMGAHLSLDPSSKDGASFRLTMRVASDRQPAMA